MVIDMLIFSKDLLKPCWQECMSYWRTNF